MNCNWKANGTYECGEPNRAQQQQLKVQEEREQLEAQVKAQQEQMKAHQPKPPPTVEGWYNNRAMSYDSVPDGFTDKPAPASASAPAAVATTSHGFYL